MAAIVKLFNPSVFVSAVTKEKSPFNAAKIAADYTIECIKATREEDNHRFGAKSEPVLSKLVQAIEN